MDLPATGRPVGGREHRWAPRPGRPNQPVGAGRIGQGPGVAVRDAVEVRDEVRVKAPPRSSGVRYRTARRGGESRGEFAPDIWGEIQVRVRAEVRRQVRGLAHAEHRAVGGPGPLLARTSPGGVGRTRLDGDCGPGGPVSRLARRSRRWRARMRTGPVGVEDQFHVLGAEEGCAVVPTRRGAGAAVGPAVRLIGSAASVPILRTHFGAGPTPVLVRVCRIRTGPVPSRDGSRLPARPLGGTAGADAPPATGWRPPPPPPLTSPAQPPTADLRWGRIGDVLGRVPEPRCAPVVKRWGRLVATSRRGL